MPGFTKDDHKGFSNISDDELEKKDSSLKEDDEEEEKDELEDVEEIDVAEEEDVEDEEEEEDEEAEEEEKKTEKAPKKAGKGKGKDSGPASLKPKVVYYCPRCYKVFYRNKWIKDSMVDISLVRKELAYCDKCLEKNWGSFIGSIEIYDKELKERKDEMIEFINNVERDMEDRQLFEKIINITEKNDILYVFTNTTKLAQEIARGIRYEYGGSIQYEWFERNQYIRVKWFSEIQNREYFKSRIRAAKENRIGVFSFEDR